MHRFVDHGGGADDQGLGSLAKRSIRTMLRNTPRLAGASAAEADFTDSNTYIVTICTSS